MAKKKVEIEDVRKAFLVLVAYGRQRRPSPDTTPGTAAGLGMASVSDGVVDASIAMLEDWNYHLCVAALAAIQHGQGMVQRKGRHLTIILPKHWEKL